MCKRFFGSITFHVSTKLGELSQEWELETEWLVHNCKDHQGAQLQTLNHVYHPAVVSVDVVDLFYHKRKNM